MFSFIKNLFKKINFSYKDFVVDKNYIDNHYVYHMEDCICNISSSLDKKFIEINDFCRFSYIKSLLEKGLEKGDIFYFCYSNEIFLFLVLEITKRKKLSRDDSFINGKCIRLKTSINQELIDFIQKNPNKIN